MKKNSSWILVCGGVVIAAIIAVLLFERHDNFGLIREEGVFVQDYSDAKVEVTVVTGDDLFLSAIVSSPIGGGGFRNMTFIPEQWAVQFQRPFELWTFNGTSFHVFEKTATGYKGTSSNIVPSIIGRVPPKLKGFADQYTDPLENKTRQDNPLPAPQFSRKRN